MTKFVDYDPVTGITETFKKDPTSNKIEVNQSQDVSQLFKHNRAQSNVAGDTWQGEFHKVASVPLVIVEMWGQEMRAAGYANPNPLAKEHEKWLIGKLNSPDFQRLRTKMGNI